MMDHRYPGKGDRKGLQYRNYRPNYQIVRVLLETILKMLPSTRLIYHL